MTNLLNISALSRRTGVAPDTLRKWEQRYGVLRPVRTSGGQRRYTEQDVARVEWLRDRQREGWRIGEASRVLAESACPGLTDPDALRDALLEATRAGNGGEIAAVLDQAFAVLSAGDAIALVLAPALRRAGSEWEAGRLSIAHEHLLSGKVRARLDAILGDVRGGVRGTAVLACAPGELHDLGLLMLAVLLRADGWRVEYLGQDTPVAEAVELAGDLDAALVCLSAARDASVAALQEGLAALDGRRGPTVAVGGGAVTASVARSLHAVTANGDPRRSVTRLRRFASG